MPEGLIYIAVIHKGFFSEGNSHKRTEIDEAIREGKPIYAMIEEGHELPEYLKPHVRFSMPYWDKHSAIVSMNMLTSHYFEHRDANS